MSEKVAIDSFAFEVLELLFDIFFVRFGDIGNGGTATGTAIEVLLSEATSFCFGVGDRGIVCSDGGKRFDDAWAK